MNGESRTFPLVSCCHIWVLAGQRERLGDSSGGARRLAKVIEETFFHYIFSELKDFWVNPSQRVSLCFNFVFMCSPAAGFAGKMQVHMLWEKSVGRGASLLHFSVFNMSQSSAAVLLRPACEF